MHDFKGFLCLALALCLIFALAAPCFADPVTLSGAEFFMSLWGTYASQHGLGMIFSENGVQSTPTNPFSVQAYREAGAQLIEDFLDYSNSIYSDAEEFYDAFKEEVTVTQDVNNQVIMHWSNTLAEWYDQFANWLLGTEYGLTATESGFAHSSGSFDSPLVSSSILGGVPVGPINVNIYSGNVASAGFTYVGSYSNGNKLYIGCTSLGNFYFVDDNGSYLGYIVFPSVVSSLRVKWIISDSSDVYVSGSSSDTSSPVVGTKFYVNANYSSLTLSPSIPVYSTNNPTSTETIDLRPKDKYNEDPVSNPIPVPDTSDAGYLPAPQDYVLNPSYVGSLPADVAALINSLTDALVENVDPLVAEGNDPAPPSMTPVELPFLGFTLPSFNLGLSSIWHYVIDWFGSLGSGISFIGSVWSNLPYAMVIPIYATAVVVIVLGMFKRFLL